MLQPAKITKILEKSVLKSILPLLHTNRDWIKWISYLGKMNNISFGNQQKEKKGKCSACNRIFDNYFLLIVHLEVIHQVFYMEFRMRLK